MKKLEQMEHQTKNTQHFKQMHAPGSSEMETSEDSSVAQMFLYRLSSMIFSIQVFSNTNESIHSAMFFFEIVVFTLEDQISN